MKFSQLSFLIILCIQLVFTTNRRDYASEYHQLTLNKDEPNYLYRVIGVTPSASPADIRKNYLQLAMRYHPDKIHTEASDADKRMVTRLFQLITGAHDILIDPSKRSNYDRQQRLRMPLMQHIPQTQPTNRPKTALYVAVERGDVAEVESLLGRSNLDVNTQGPVGKTLLHEAIRLKHLAIVQILLDNGADPNIQQDTGETPLVYAVYTGCPTAIRLLLTTGKADPNIQNTFGNTVLHRAINQRASNEIFQMLLESGARVDIIGDGNSTPIHMAAREGFVDALRAFVLYGNVDSVDLRDDKSNQTPLHYAAINGEANAVKFLLANGADRRLKDLYGKTPSDLASNWKTKLAFMKASLRRS